MRAYSLTPSSRPALRTRRSSTSEGRASFFPPACTAARKEASSSGGPLSLGRLACILHSPWFAGTYAFGRSRRRKQPDGGTRQELLPPSEWLAFIRDAHPGYISWQQYLQTQQRLQSSAKALHFGRSQSPPREGPALLQGRAVCGLCGPYTDHQGPRTEISSTGVRFEKSPL